MARPTDRRAMRSAVPRGRPGAGRAGRDGAGGGGWGAAPLAAGNTVILKPASDTVLVAYLLCQCFWRAGVPRTALQFAPCSGGTVGQRLGGGARRGPGDLP